MPTSHSQPWHAMTGKQVLAQLGATGDGLTGTQADERLDRYGPNTLPERGATPIFRVFLLQLANPLILILIVAAAVSLSIGHVTDAGFIGGVVLVNAVVGGFHQNRAERGVLALRRLLRTTALVLRDREVRECPAERVVPGDAILLEPGNRIPADARLLSSHALELDESLLTGESAPVHKDAASVCEADTAASGRAGMVFAGTLIIRGRGKAVVVGTGLDTEVGRLAIEVLHAPRGKPPLLVRLERFTRVIGLATVAAAASVGLLGVLLLEQSPGEMFLFAVALAVSAIPEGLPIAITVALAVGSSRMAARGVVIRSLGAVEGLGSCTLIASDKTGTLTCNELTVREISMPDGTTYSVRGEGYAPNGRIDRDGEPVIHGEDANLDEVCLAFVLCNEADLFQRDGVWAWRGDPTDVALLSAAHKLGVVRELIIDRYPQVGQIPFEPEIRFAASYNRSGDSLLTTVKGAPERVLAMCRGDSASTARAFAVSEEMARRGLRVLAIAVGESAAGAEEGTLPEEPSGLRLAGFVGMMDPLRPGAEQAIEECERAGVRVCMITGDHPSTALAISKELGLADSMRQVVTGSDPVLDDPIALRDAMAEVRVFARISPAQKLAIVRAAQGAGHFVAVTGDGANDAPALRAANIGAAMGRSGTDIAREACDLVISDDDLASVVSGIREGRIAYDNIRKVVYLLVSTGGAEVLLVAAAVGTSSPLPLLPAQLLWLNLVTNGIQDVALAFEREEGDVLDRRPRPPNERIFDRVMIENCLVSAVLMAGIGYVAFQWMLRQGWTEASARNALLLLMVMFENALLGNARSETRFSLRLSPLRSPVLLVGAAVAFTLHAVLMHLPIGSRLLGLEPVSGWAWAGLAALALLMFSLVEANKARRRARRRD